MKGLTGISRDSMPLYITILQHIISDTFSYEATNCLSNTFLNEAAGKNKFLYVKKLYLYI